MIGHAPPMPPLNQGESDAFDLDAVLDKLASISAGHIGLAVEYGMLLAALDAEQGRDYGDETT